MGLPDRHDYLEADSLKLSAEHFPLTCSLHQPVLARFTDPAASASDEQAMAQDELLGYLRNIDNFDIPPLQAVLDQTEVIGDPALPTPAQVAILRWLEAAYQAWEKQFPLEDALATQLRQLKPLAAALAVTDPGFLQPGAHPLHRLLDAIQASAIGWQASLGRAGLQLDQRISRAVSDALGWFNDDDTDLAAIAGTVAANANRNQARAYRMTQRVIEVEQGRLKTAQAKSQAAAMINTALATYPAPKVIGELLQGPWYESAQLVLLKFGADSNQWREMSRTTETLLDSLQNPETAAKTRRQHIFHVVTQIPKDLRRSLLSLQHDHEAVNEAVGLVEFLHLRVLRQQPLDLEYIAPIAIAAGGDTCRESVKQLALPDLATGRWFRIDAGNDQPLRLQLVLMIDREQQLLFCNQAGLRVLQLDYRDFARLQAEGKVNPLEGGASFSRALAGAAGIDSSEALARVTDSQAQPLVGQP
jgi:hypothetical protein